MLYENLNFKEGLITYEVPKTQISLYVEEFGEICDLSYLVSITLLMLLMM